MDKFLQTPFFELVRLGLGRDSSFSDMVDWNNLQALAMQQGLSALVLDGVEKLPDKQRPPKGDLLQWIGETLQSESQYAIKQKAATGMALLFHNNLIKTYVLKGEILAECYPKPIHRISTDLDCFLLPLNGDFDAWSLGNDLIRTKGFEVETVFYKNSTFWLPGLMVENHQFLTPFRGNKSLKNLERMLQTLLREDKGEDRIEGTWLYRPPVMVTALFLIEHAYSHFLHEGLTWRMVLDWALFREMHRDDIDWPSFDEYVDEFGFRKFYDAFQKLGKFLLGDVLEDELLLPEKKMLMDIWAPLDLHKTVRGFIGKLALAGNTWRARWKYRNFAEMSWLRALWIQIKGYMFIKEPSPSSLFCN